MKDNQITALAEQGESHTLEFKKSTSQLKPACETVCAFLNGKGGVVLIGVLDSGQVVGQNVADNTRQDIAREVQKIEPPAQIEISYQPYNDGKFIIVFEVAAGNQAPYTYDGRAYERNQTTTLRMSQQRYDQLVSHRFHLNFAWEKIVADDYVYDDLDSDLILGVVRKAIEVKRLPEDVLRQEIPTLLEAMKLSSNGHLINAAVVLFGKKSYARLSTVSAQNG